MKGKRGGSPFFNRSKKRLAVLLVVVVLVAAASLVLSWKDLHARKGYYEGKSKEEIQADLDAKVDWYSMEISVASAMQVQEGQTRVEARIENVVNNHCDQKVRMYLKDDPSDVLFESGAIAPGEYLQFVDLSHELPVGRNYVTVEFQGYEQSLSLVSNEGSVLGHDLFGASAAAEVTIDVLPANVVRVQDRRNES